jgi:hypothetical protein
MAENLEKGLGKKNFFLTKEELQKQCPLHLQL